MLEEVELVGHWVIAMSAPGVASQNTPDGKTKTLDYSVLLYGLDGIGGACGSEPARGGCQR